jgi:hypothetical protein
MPRCRCCRCRRRCWRAATGRLQLAAVGLRTKVGPGMELSRPIPRPRGVTARFCGWSGDAGGRNPPCRARSSSCSRCCLAKNEAASKLVSLSQSCLGGRAPPLPSAGGVLLPPSSAMLPKLSAAVGHLRSCRPHAAQFGAHCRRRDAVITRSPWTPIKAARGACMRTIY